MEESQRLMEKFIILREKYSKSNNKKDLFMLNKHERICVEKFKYLVSMRTDRYRGFYNYEDLNQEGLEALIKAMKNYDPKKGSWFWWAHKYIETRISRSANLHTTIRYPLKFAKLNTPHKESVLPILVEGRFCPDKNLERAETLKAIQSAMEFLNKEQKDIISFAYGFDGDKPLSINKICKKMNISRLSCIKTINSALNILKQNIQI
ncbi:MAG TPA: sigma-70 family RNA polymerase sigma factor [Puia sp.]